MPPIPPSGGIPGWPLGFAPVSHHALGGDQQPGDRGVILQCHPHDLGRVDNAGCHRILVFAGLGIIAEVRVALVGQLTDDDERRYCRMTTAASGSRSHPGVPTEPLDKARTVHAPVGRFHRSLEPSAHIRVFEGAQGRSPGAKTLGDRRICSDCHRFSSRSRYRSALPRRIARYSRRHPGHHLGRRRDGQLRGAGQRCSRQTNRRGTI